MIWFKIFYTRASKPKPQGVYEWIVRLLGDMFWCVCPKMIETALLNQKQNYDYSYYTL